MYFSAAFVQICIRRINGSAANVIQLITVNQSGFQRRKNFFSMFYKKISGRGTPRPEFSQAFTFQ